MIGFLFGLLRVCALLACVSVTHAAIDPDEFENDTERARYQQFIADLRCPKCQNQNLAGSDAPIAADLRKELRRLLKEGQSDAQIVDFMVARYGEFVLYKPRFDRNTAVLWLAPVLLFGIGASVIAVILWRHRRARIRPAQNATLTADEQAELVRLLQPESLPGEAGAPSDSKRRNDA